MVYHVTYPPDRHDPQMGNFTYVASDEAGFPGVYDINGRLLWDTMKCMGIPLQEWIVDAMHHGAAAVKVK